MSSQKIDNLINILENNIENRDMANSKVSKANVAWHIDHSFKVINGVIKTLQTSDSSLYKNNFSFLGKLFFSLGFFPRGKAQAPKNVKPPEIILEEDLINQLEQSKILIKALPDLDKNAFFKHPMFGDINKPKIYRFLELHTNHHVKIINEIMAK
ncbi:DUF1569 domain-containing protein [Bizionia argentinensis JUB59]|uniref:DUF1569 domain-containing protein n=1 Tax=Bizionia argentinensis JUB59 TaxID=1046627 RepID=G2EHC5_9FLAO|nr:DUF1569 domain-containing protein [Bizionia argentinensis]EGV42124.1 DUF1569 domain-containing protein [Bizionia argentinensis JUB59]